MWLQERWPILNRGFVQAAMFLLVVLQFAYGLPYYPYYLTYRNPILSGPSAVAYGNGLDQAATYLAQKPDAKETVVYAYLGMGSFSYFYPGETKIFKRVDLLNNDYDVIVAEMHESNYLVVYSAAQNTQPESQKFLGAIKDVQPEKVIMINGIEYARIYRIADIPESAYQEMTR